MWLRQICELSRVEMPGHPYYLLVAFWSSQGDYRTAEPRYPTDPAICQRHPALLKDWLFGDFETQDIPEMIAAYAAEAKASQWSGDDTYRDFPLYVRNAPAPKGFRIQPFTRVEFMMAHELRLQVGKLVEV